MHEIIFEAHSDSWPDGLFLCVYRFPRKTLGYFFSDSVDGGYFLEGISIPVDIILRLYGSRVVMRFKRILELIVRMDEELLFYINPAFFDFLSIYLEQRKIKMKYVKKEIEKNDYRTD